MRFKMAIREGKTLFRLFKVPLPSESTKDILYLERTTNAYRKISLDGMELKVPGVNPYEEVELRMVPDDETGLTDIRFRYKGNLFVTRKIKTADLKRVYS